MPRKTKKPGNNPGSKQEWKKVTTINISYDKYNINTSIFDLVKENLPDIETMFYSLFPGHELTRKGHRLWTKCPFHAEKTASFTLNPDRQKFYCFGCHAYGDRIDLYSKAYNLDIGRAIKQIAAEMDIIQDNIDPETKAKLRLQQKRRQLDSAKEEYAERQLVDLVDNEFKRLIKLETVAQKIITSIETPDDLDKPEVAAAIISLERIRYYLDPLTSGEPGEQLAAALVARQVEF